jgi:hypothetical protein
MRNRNKEGKKGNISRKINSLLKQQREEGKKIQNEKKKTEEVRKRLK